MTRALRSAPPVILTKDHPIGDVLFGVDNTFLARRAPRGHLRSDEGAGQQLHPRRCRLPAGSEGAQRVMQIDHGAVCINYDRSWFARHRIPEQPQTLADLAEEPPDAGICSSSRIRRPRPRVSRSCSQPWITSERAGSHNLWTQLRDNGVEVVNGWEEAYNGSFTAAGAREGTVTAPSSCPSGQVRRPRPCTSPTRGPKDLADRHRPRRHVLRAGGARGRPAGQSPPQGRRPHTGRVHALQEVPSGRPPCDVRVSGARRTSGFRSLFTQVRGRSRAPGVEIDPREHRPQPRSVDRRMDRDTVLR